MGLQRTPKKQGNVPESVPIMEEGAVGGAIDPPPTVEYNCRSYERPDTDEMVQCNRCDQWHHYDCVGVDNTISDRSWLCPDCFTRRGRQQERDNLVEATSSVSNTSRLSKAEISIRRLELLRQRDVNFQQQLEVLNTIQTEEENAINTNQDRVPDDKTGAIPRTYTQSGAPLTTTRTRVSWATPRQGNRPESNARHQFDFPPPPAANASTPQQQQQQRPKLFEQSEQQRRPQQSEQLRRHQPSERRSQQSARQQHVPVEPTVRQPAPVSSSTAEITEQLQRLIIRQAIPKDLPSFSGRTEEWSAFISAYNQANAVGNLSNNENFLRLQHALRGKAREMVESQLALPECVPTTIDTLSSVFGNPDRLIHNQIDRIRRAPVIKADKLDALVDFFLLVSNLVATLTAVELHNYRDEPVLIREVINKLPNRYKLEWAAYKRRNQNEIIRDGELIVLSNLLHQIAMDACMVMDKPPHSSDSNDRYRKDRPFVNIHDEEPSDDDYELDDGPETVCIHPQLSICTFCKKDCDELLHCTKFTNVPLNEKWDFVRNHKLCRMCFASREVNLNYLSKFN